MANNKDQQRDAELEAAIIKFVADHVAAGGTRDEAFALVRQQMSEVARSSFKIVPE